MKKLLQNQIKIGAAHIITQTIAFIILTKGIALLYLQALAESPGWVMLGLWVVFNFFVLVLLVNLLDLVLSTLMFNAFGTIIKITAIALSGGIISFIFYLVYYRYHFYYIDKKFYLNDFREDFWSLVMYISPVIAFGGLIRRSIKLIQKIRISNRKLIE